MGEFPPACLLTEELETFTVSTILFYHREEEPYRDFFLSVVLCPLCGYKISYSGMPSEKSAGKFLP